MKNNYKKKLIEVAIPLEVINAASAREKSIRHGHPSTLHLWWARRPLAACRAVLFCQLVDDPSGYVGDLLADEKSRKAAEAELKAREKKREDDKAEGKNIPLDDKPPNVDDIAIELERKRLFKIVEDLVKWENSTNEEVLERARAEIRRCCGDELPPVYDPFSGGGSIPLEAQRLGLPAYGSDLNPVAVMIGKAMIEIPPKFKNMEPIHPGGKGRNHYRNAEGLAEDVKRYGEWMREKAWERIGHLYPKADIPKELGGGQATIIAWFWARTVPSPDPAFSDVHVPIASSFLLSTKKGKEAWIQPVIDKASRQISYEIRYGGTKAELDNAKSGTKAGRGANFVCLMSDTAITPEYVKRSGKSGEMGQVLIAIAAEGQGKRIYVAPTSEQVRIARSELPNWKPETKLPNDPRNFWTVDYGLTNFGDLFTDRQLVSLNAFSELLVEARRRIEADALSAGLSDDGVSLRNDGTGAKAYSEAVGLYLAFAIDRSADAWSAQVSWRNSVEASRSTFSRQALPMVWDFVELNPFSNSNGNWTNASVEWVYKSLGALCPAAKGTITQGDAQSVHYPGASVVSSDPPYYDNITYADLSDFFFIWLRKNTRETFPEITGTLAVPKAEELIAAPYRHGGSDRAEEFFLTGMKQAVSNMANNSHAEYPTAIYYAFKQSEISDQGVVSTGWATFIQAVIDSGFEIHSTWPMRTEKPGRMISVGANALANSVVLSCRKKQDEAETITRAEFIRALKRELPPSITELQAANVSPADMPQSSIGPGMGVFSRYRAVLEADDSPMTVKTALQLINRELDDFLSDIQGEFDPETRFSIIWYEQNGVKEGDFGTADSLARARGISVDDVKHAGIVESAAGKVRILKRDELLEDWDPNSDAHLTVWECCQYLIHTLEKEGEYAAALLLRKMGADTTEAVKDLAYCLYDICSNKRKDAKEATSYNGLIAVWSELTRQAATIPDYEVTGDRQTAMDI